MKNLNYGIIGNCKSAALISEKGWVEWCCLPDFDSPAVFSKLLDEKKGGEFGFEVDDSYTITQKYVERSNILCTIFSSEKGVFEVLDFMPRYKTNESSHFVPSEIYRYIRHISGNPSCKICYNPKLDYARNEVHHVANGECIKTLADNHSESIYLYTDFDFSAVIHQHEVPITGQHYLLLSYNQKLIPINIDRVYLEYTRTKTYWLNWLNRTKTYKLYSEDINRSLLVLKLLTFQPTGAILAAITTSLPEAIGENRNWDYRFCWIRDASMSIDTLLNLGHDDAAKKFLFFIKNIVKSKSDSFQIMYGIRGERELEEATLDHLAGYENSLPVRIGNAAYYQEQNDIYGYLMNVIYRYYRNFPGTLDELEDMWSIVRNIVRTVTKRWAKPDKGIWEIRNESKHFVFSKVMCWVAMDRAIGIARLLKKTDSEQQWKRIAQEIKDDIMLHGWNEELKSFTQTYDNTAMDASLLLMEEYGFISAKDEKYIQTVLAIKKELLHDGLMYRYVNSDDFGEPTSAFTICTFWLIRALYKVGYEQEAKMLFDSLLKNSNHLGLFSEDIEFQTKRLLGNFPQAYSHLALINTATLFSEKNPMIYFIKP